jgi:hypothetical protein
MGRKNRPRFGLFACPTPKREAPQCEIEAGDPEAIGVYLSEQDAQRALEDCLRDEPE